MVGYCFYCIAIFKYFCKKLYTLKLVKKY
jgi:hypothetical protein